MSLYKIIVYVIYKKEIRIHKDVEEFRRMQKYAFKVTNKLLNKYIMMYM